MQKTFEFIGGVIIIIFMVVVLMQATSQNKSDDVPPIKPPTEQPTTNQTPEVTEDLSAEDFAFELQEAVRIEIGQPIEGYEPAMFMQVFLGLLPEDFDGVEAQIGMYEYMDGELTHVLGDVDMVHSAAPAVTEEGMDTLLSNVIDRLAIDPDTTTAGRVAERLRHKDRSTTSEEDPEDGTLIACTMDAMQCPDGSFIGRTGPDCEFVCPDVPTEPSEATICSDESKQVDACIEIYQPVCGLVEVQCITTPCNPVPQTFGNSCAACSQGNVLSYTEGECSLDE